MPLIGIYTFGIAAVVVALIALGALTFRCLSRVRCIQQPEARSSVPLDVPRCSCRCGCREWRALVKTCLVCVAELCPRCRVPACKHPDEWGGLARTHPSLSLGVWCHICMEEELAKAGVAASRPQELVFPHEWPSPSPRHRAHSGAFGGKQQE